MTGKMEWDPQMKRKGTMDVLNDKMKQVAYVIGKHMIMILPDKYQKMIFDTIPMMEIVLQILVECCEDAYSFQAPKLSLWSFMKDDQYRKTGEREIAADYRMRLQRAAALRNERMSQLSKYVLSNYGLHLPVTAYDKEDDHYSINAFDFLEMCQMDDIELWKVVLNRKYDSQKFYNDDFRRCASGYDEQIEKLQTTAEEGEEQQVINSLSMFTIEGHFYFDFLYKIVSHMEENHVKGIPDMEGRITAFCYQPTIKTVLTEFCNWPFLPELTTYSRAVRIRCQFAKDIGVLPNCDEYEFRQALYLEALYLITLFQAATLYEGMPLREWFRERTGIEDWASVLHEYNVFSVHVAGKEWSNKKIRYAKNVYKAMTYTYQTSEK